MKIVDLHAHTTASDAHIRRQSLLDTRKKKGLSAIAITDHDTVAGVEELYRRQEAGDPGNPGSGAQHSHGRL